jgi:SAM-dependent methyltransferase
MGHESTKARARRTREHYFERYLVGVGIDIGCGDDPVTISCLGWDLAQGDAAELPGIGRHEFDWVYSSHCLEHLMNPWRVIHRWWEVLRPGGHLLVVVPDEDLYEQGFWPSRFNGDHKWTFTIDKDSSWSPVSINLTQLVSTLRCRRTIWIRLCDDGYDYSPEVWDRTSGSAEAHIEVLLRKQPNAS